MTRARPFPAGLALTVAALLLIVFAVRAHAPLAMPAFNDESLHIRRSEIVWSFENPATSFTVGKLLGYYWLGAFGFARLDALIGGRLVFALLILPGAAATYRVGRSLFGRPVGLLALLLYALAPYLIFYERLILADQIAAMFGMLALWLGIRLARRPTVINGLLAGACVSLAVLAKLTAIPFALVPLLAVWMLGVRTAPPPAGVGARAWLARRIPPRYWRPLLAAYGFNLISGLPFMPPTIMSGLCPQSQPSAAKDGTTARHSITAAIKTLRSFFIFMSFLSDSVVYAYAPLNRFLLFF